ncbi:uncharacterized protein LOC133302204 [Gastrolobium bilobum]|uniref:uncharacterized protein LOC133302204 n=1 Tax=Gastrolobium bilobum TaxID=150636 RepID=UPI002AB1609E|nr:uncharacterized protein LOC133302204 [Gastrolobium bilobum]
MTRLRKLQKMEGQRRSPRLSALESGGSGHSKSCIKSHLDNDQGPASRTRGIKKRKLKPLQQVTATTSPNEGVKHSLHEDQPSKLSSSTILPEKRLLELVLDTLQRRDTYEIFAEPVDPNEVQDYYAITKEPMDFGTMRAKLHEGMYKNLEQFEVYNLHFILYAHHDVFLIFNNAMNFNSSGTIYFRQARVINELAKKVFDVLKTDPDKFELEFSETKRKVGRRNQGDLMNSTDMKSSEITIGVTSKTASCSSRGTSNRKIFKTNHGCSDIAKHVDARDVEFPIGTKDGSRCRSMEVDRRCTYRPLSLDGDESIFSTVYGKLKHLDPVNQQDHVGYKDSLMMFVKDLGPTAQNIAKRKLLGCEIRTAASTSAPWRPNTFNTVPTPSLISQYPLEGNTHMWCDKVFPNQSFCSEDLNCSKESGNKSRMMLLENQEQRSVSITENSQTNVLENNCKFHSRPWQLESSSDVSCLVQDKSQMQKSSSECVLSDRKNIETHEISCSYKAMETVPLASGFVFDLPYLKTRLDQIKSSRAI